MMKSGISYSIPAPAIRQWLAANHLSPSPFPLAQAQQPLPNMAEPEANRSFATGYLLQTIAMVLRGDADLLKLAIRHYCVAAELRPDVPSIVRNLGLAYASLEQWDKAVQAYSKALALAPDDRNYSPTRPSHSSDQAGQKELRPCTKRPSIRLIPQRRRNACTVRCGARSPTPSPQSPWTWPED